MKIKAGIIGATGYAGAELVRLLLGHSGVQLAAISSVSFEGQSIAEVYPAFLNITDMVLTNEDEVIEKSDVVFASLPHGLCEKIAAKCAVKDKAFIDLGADFRLENECDYNEWYGLDYNEKALHEKAVYSIPELHRAKTAQARLIANPGCYPTSIALALAPLLKEGVLDLSSIIIDSKSGVTGAGRGLTQNTHYPDCNENFAAYKIASHRHTPEIEQTLSALSGEEIKVTFVPHLLPVNRGILSTVYANAKKGFSRQELNALYKGFYEGERFLRILENDNTACIKNVKYTNYCDISLHPDARTGRIIIVSAIDNMVKGAAGQAIQNMNIIFGLNEAQGLCLVPPSF